MKLRRKALSILLTLSLMVAMLVPLAAPAGAYASYTALTTPTVSDDTTATLGKVLIQTVANAVYTGNAGTVNFRLPSDYEFNWYTSTNTTGITVDANKFVTNPASLIDIPPTYSSDLNGLSGIGYSIQKVADNEIQFKITNTTGTTYTENDGYMYLSLTNINIPSGENGEVKLTAIAPSSSGFGSGEVVVAKVVGSGKVALTVDEVQSFTDEQTVTLRFKEFITGSLEKDTESVKLRLPAGFEWGTPGTPTKLWGSDAFMSGLTFDKEDRDLYLNVGTETTSANGGPTYFSVPLTIQVEDETTAKYGDVTVSVSGPSTVDPTSLVVAKYAEMSATAKCDTPLDVVAGKTEQKIGDIVIEEGAPNSITEGRSVTLTLPANAKWGEVPSVTSENSLDMDGTKGFDFVGNDGRTLKFWVTNDDNADDPGKITLEDAEVILAGDITGDLAVEVGGTAEIGTDKITVAMIKAPVTATASTKPEVKIGMQEQVAGDITIVEGMKEAIADDENLVLWVGNGVQFSDKPKVEVTEGDLDIDVNNIRLANNDTELIIPIDAESTTAATIKVTDVKFDIDRTVAVGDIKVKVGGLAVNEVNDEVTLEDYYSYVAAHNNYYQLDSQQLFERDEDGAFPGADEVASAVNATCATPAPDQKVGTVVFTIGDTKYTVNGEEKTADVAPYIKSDRTYVSVRYVAEALGVPAENIIWNGDDQTVVLIKGDRVVKLTLGSTTLYINGVAFNMDVAPELVDPGRTMLPIRWVGQALGATLSWDEATQKVTVTL